MAEKNPEQKEIFDQTTPHSIEKEITQSYIDYAMSVIVSRALPDTRDGMKPVIRRILYAMYDIGLNHNAKYRKSAAVVGEVLAKYHPHGDSSVYDAMVRLAQPFSLRYPLVDGQGNFGSIDGDGAAAMRYTEARLTKIAEEMIEDIEQDTVDRRQNYDDSRQEPVTMPTKFPNHLCNGTMGIAVGMATNMAPHNLTEVIDATLLLMGNADATIDDIMEIIKGPDFPTGGMMYDKENIKAVYSTGKGGITVRGRTHIEEGKNGKIIVIDEIPYQVNKSTLVAKIGELTVDKKLEGITDIRDESNRVRMRVSITLRKGVDANAILTKIFKYTELQSNFNVNNVTLVEKGMQPRLLNIKDLLMEFVDYRRQVVYRRSNYQLMKAKDRLHILDGLKRAIDILDEVIYAIRHSDDKQQAKEKLMGKNFDFSDVQAEYILQMRLQSLVGLEIQKIVEEINEKKALIEYLEGILNDPKKLDKVVTDEMKYIKKTYGDERRTELVGDGSANLSGSMKELLKQEDAKKEDVILWIGADHSFRILYQSRVNVLPEDTIELVYTHNQDKLIIITDKGELVIQRLKDIGSHNMKSPAVDPKEQWNLKGNIVFCSSMLHDYKELVFLTSHNNLKKIDKELLLSFKKFPTTVMTLEDKEKIIAVEAVRTGDKIGILSQKGSLSLFPEAGVRPMGKTAGGVKAIAVEEGDGPAALLIYKDEPFIMINGTNAAKMIAVEDLVFGKSQFGKRGGKVVQIAEIEGKDKIAGGIAMVEGSVRIKLTTGELKTVHSDKVLLDMPDTPMEKIVTGTIERIYRPWEEKSENTAWKDARTAETKAEKKADAEDEDAE